LKWGFNENEKVMRTIDLKIGTRLILGVGAILALVIFLTLICLNQSNRLWLNTNNLYNHPYQVGIAAREVRVNILAINTIVLEIGLKEELTTEEINSLMLRTDSLEKVINSEFALISDRFLGSKNLIDSVLSHYQDWEKVRDGFVQARFTKGFAESNDLLVEVNRISVTDLLTEIDEMTDFATMKGEEFYSQASADKTLMIKRLVIAIILILLISILITFFTVRSITKPLGILNTATNKYKSGNYDSRCSYESDNELGALSVAFNEMASVVQSEISVNANIAKVSGILMEENELRPFCRKLIETFVNYTNSQVVAILIRNEITGYFENYESTGLDSDKIKSFDSKRLEGEIGTVITTGKIIRIRDIPAGSVLSVNTVAGDFVPAEIISIPIRNNMDIPAIISISSINPYSENTIKLLEGIWTTLSSRMMGVLSFQKLSDMSVTLEKQNSELEEKSKELVAQSAELKEYNVELEIQKKHISEANRLKSAFLSNMSHELRTPLNSVIALSGVLRRKTSGKIPADEYGYLKIIEKNGKNLLELINNILDLSRIEAGREEISFSRFSLNSLVDELITVLKPLSDEKGIEIVFRQEADLPDIFCDREKCLHIIQNLISNAVKFTREGSVNISAVKKNDFYTVTVRDTGIGISEDFLPYVFDEFRQADDRNSRKFEGTGLGLSIVKKYCKLLDGDISVESVIGKGTSFTVRLPDKNELDQSDGSMKHIQKPFSEGRSREELAISTERNGRKILVVEDNEAQIIQLRDILDREGFIIDEAHNGKEALDAIKESIPDAMILDLQMPVLDGFEVLNELRSINGAEKIPVIIMSAKHLTKEDLKLLKGNNIHQLIQKGNVNVSELKGYINKIFPAHKTLFKKGKPGNNTILIIEDNPDNLATFNALLKESYNVVTAPDGNSGMKFARESLPGMVLLDISLHGEDGFLILDKFREDQSLADIPVIALTARAMKGDREQILNYGFDGYIPKPVDPDTFETIVKDYFKKIKKK